MSVEQPLPMVEQAEHGEHATIVATYPKARGALALRGSHPPLDWFHGRPPDRVDGDTSVFLVPMRHGETVEVKLVRSDGAWMVGRNAVGGCGDTLVVDPSFDRPRGLLGAWRTLEVPGSRPLRFRVMVPPSYDEQEGRRYPVLYAQDGQSVWSDTTDPFGGWSLDTVLDELWDLGALEECLVVSIDTGEDRLTRLSPVADPHHGGGGAQKHLDAMIGALKPLVDREHRTRSERSATTVLGASMGGLFSFWAAWTRPDVFGGAICLSPSFWWADRWMVREVEAGACPTPRPRLYLDSGAARWASEPDGSTRDGVHNTRAMYRALIGQCDDPHEDLHVLAYPGYAHDARSWAARVSTPLQMMLPRST
jgi:predicted alpha/beta superfamily hydrolase